MKQKIFTIILAAALIGSVLLYTAKCEDPAPRQQRSRQGMNPEPQSGQGQEANRQQMLPKWMEELNKAYEAKDYQKVDQLVGRYANARQRMQGQQAPRQKGQRGQGPGAGMGQGRTGQGMQGRCQGQC